MKYCESPEWKRYVQLWEQRPLAFAKGNPEIITDEALIEEYAKATGKGPGVFYESPYHILAVDLVRSSKEELFTYERVLPAVEKGAVVAVPKCGDKFVVLRQFRHAPREEMLAFPRGFGEEGLTGEENLIKELGEEIGVTDAADIKFLGKIAPDSGILATEAEVFFCNVKSPLLKEGYEGIRSVELFSDEELRAKIKAGEIKDGYTLAAYALYCVANSSSNK